MERLKSWVMNLKELRQSKNLMQKTVAARIGVSRPTYYRYENSLFAIPVGMLTPLARTFGISVSHLLEVIAETQND